MPHSPVGGSVGHPAARRALVLAAAAGTVLSAGHAVPAVAAAHGPVQPSVPADDVSDTPQGGKSPLHGPVGKPAPGDLSQTAAELPPTTRAEIMQRARQWIVAEVPYSMYSYWDDGYRQDCSGFVSMAWNLGRNEWTGSLDKFAERIEKEELLPGDMLLFHNPYNPQSGSHVVLFGGWTDPTHSRYIVYEQTRPRARTKVTPYAYWSNASRYVPYRYKGLVEETARPEPEVPEPKTLGFPGAAHFGAGTDNSHVTRLGRMLVNRGGARFYTTGPGRRWSDADRRATQAFQRAQGWSGPDADGLPGPATWAYLIGGRGRNIPPAGSPGAPGRSEAARRPASHGVAGYPGRAMFRPGAHNQYVTQLGKQLVKRGFGKHYTSGPGPRWSEADRRNVEAFQRAQGWRGGAADGYPGPETWRRLFS